MKVEARMRRYAWFLGLVVVALGLHEVLLRVMARGHVAHVLLGAGSGAPPALAAAAAVAFMVLRFGVIVVLPGALGFVAARYVFRAVERRRAPSA